MSSTSTTPVRIPKTSPISNKQGPLKATIPISGVLKHSSNLRHVSSTPSPPPHWRARYSPDNASGQRSPGSVAYRGKPISAAEAIRRTASLDAIYLKGQWPRDSLYWNMGILQVDKATQTEEGDWSDARLVRCSSETEEKVDKFLSRPKSRGSRDSSRHPSPGDLISNSSAQTLASCIASPSLKMNHIALKPLPSKSSMRSSVEGLNQEIERIVLKTYDSHYSDRPDIRHPTPEGHRAPLAEILRYTRSRSVNTQTPQEFGGSCHSSGNSSRESSSSLFRRLSTDDLSDSADGSSPENEILKFSTSPHINRFLAREPPDGCEKVRLKTVDEKKNIQMEHTPPPSTFKLRPSLGSAFHILQPNMSDMEEQETAQGKPSTSI